MSEPVNKKPRTDGAGAGAAPYDGPALELKAINSIRAVSADLPSAANSGHPGAPMGCAPLAHLLWNEVMTYSPSCPKWWNRDRFVLSNGHACALQYVMLHLTGYDVTLDDLRGFRKLGSKTPGHPENFGIDGIEVSTGPLGQGISNSVGFAIAERHLAATYNTDDFPSLFDNHTFVICGDGCLQEGISSEASSLAGHLGLGKLIVLYDDNDITIDGSTDLSFTEDVCKRYEAYGWHVQKVVDVASGLKDLRAAVNAAVNVTDRPSLISVKTVIGYGSLKEGHHSVHGAPLKPDDLKQLKKRFGFDPEKTFHVEDDVMDMFKERTKAVEAKKAEWDAMYAKYKEKYPAKAAELERRFSETLPDGVLDKLPTYQAGKDKDKATRQFSELCLNAIAPHMPELVGGSADLTPSNLTELTCSGDFQKGTPEGRYLRFGVREHGMTAITNGIFAYGAFRPFCATFLNFAGYAMGAIRLSALSKFGVIFVMTHDSIGLGEDGPTHQPVEMLECLRATPNINVFRPADGNETSAAYHSALLHQCTPTIIACSRSTVVGLERSTVDKAIKGAYVVYGPEENGDKKDGMKIDLIIVATGSEVGPSLDAAKELHEGESKLSVRVVSMPCQELFLAQSAEYRHSILPGTVPTLSVEASTAHGWHRFSHGQVAMDRFGYSGKGPEVFAKFGYSKENIASKGRELVEFYNKKGLVPDLNARPEFVNFQGKDHEGEHTRKNGM